MCIFIFLRNVRFDEDGFRVKKVKKVTVPKTVVLKSPGSASGWLKANMATLLGAAKKTSSGESLFLLFYWPKNELCQSI